MKKNNKKLIYPLVEKLIFIAVFLLFKEIGSLFTYLYLLSNVFFLVSRRTQNFKKYTSKSVRG